MQRIVHRFVGEYFVVGQQPRLRWRGERDVERGDDALVCRLQADRDIDRRGRFDRRRLRIRRSTRTNGRRELRPS
ncbi:MAG: hypothetical protein WDW38_000265 [Sanguina aurantia]